MKSKVRAIITGTLICCILCSVNYRETGKRTEAEQHLKMVAAMCPARFMPLLDLAKLYDVADRKDEALAMAIIIIKKEVKVPSPAIDAIMSILQTKQDLIPFNSEKILTTWKSSTQ